MIQNNKLRCINYIVLHYTVLREYSETDFTMKNKNSHVSYLIRYINIGFFILSFFRTLLTSLLQCGLSSLQQKVNGSFHLIRSLLNGEENDRIIMLWKYEFRRVY